MNEDEAFVRKILPGVKIDKFPNGWIIYAATGCPCLVTGAKSSDDAWKRAARLLGRCREAA